MKILQGLFGNKRSEMHTAKEITDKPSLMVAPFILPAKDVFRDFALNGEQIDKLRTMYFKASSQGKGINSIANLILPRTKEKIDCFPGSLREYYIDRGYELDALLMMQTYIQAYSLAGAYDEQRRARRGYGMYIMVAKKCSICSQFDNVKYSWQEIDAGLMPRLPLHWGCSCTVGTWVR